MPIFGGQNINRTFCFSSKRLNMLGGTLFVVCFLLNTLFLLFFAVELIIASALVICWRLTRKNIFRTLLLSFWPLLTFFNAHDLLRKGYCNLPVRTLTSKKVDGTLFVVWSSLNKFLLPFSGTLTWKCMHDTFPVPVYTVETSSKPYFFVYDY